MNAPDLNQIRHWLEQAPQNPENVSHALLAIAERLDTANEIAAAQVYASMGEANYGLARKIVEAARGA